MTTLLSLCLLVIVLAAAAAPPASAVCVPRNAKPPVKAPPIVRPPIGAPVPKPAPPPVPKPRPPPAAPPEPAGGDTVKSLCGKTDYPDLCLSAIAGQPVPPGGKLDAAGVLKLAMGAVRGKAGEAKKKANELVADPKTDTLALGPLRDCVESYDDMAYSLDEAEKAMASGDKDTTGTMLDTVRTDVDTCDQGFEEREELTPLMSTYDEALAKLSSNCIAIAAAAGLR